MLARLVLLATSGEGTTAELCHESLIERWAKLRQWLDESEQDADFLARLREIAPDCCPVTAYGALIPQRALDIPAHGWVNLHFSLLPAWRGAAPVQHAILRGDEVTGASTFRIVA